MNKLSSSFFSVLIIKSSSTIVRLVISFWLVINPETRRYMELSKEPLVHPNTPLWQVVKGSQHRDSRLSTHNASSVPMISPDDWSTLLRWRVLILHCRKVHRILHAKLICYISKMLLWTPKTSQTTSRGIQVWGIMSKIRTNREAGKKRLGSS